MHPVGAGQRPARHVQRPPAQIRRTSPKLPRHCEEGKARRGNPFSFRPPRGDGRCEAPQGMRIATSLRSSQ